MRQQRITGRTARGGFTLVEMLVSVALVLVIMTMFASAFQIATGTLLQHRGIAENDQRARAAVTILDGDLSKRTFRQSDDYTDTEMKYPLTLDPVYIDVDPPIDPTVYPDQSNPDPTLYRNNLLNRANQQGLGIVPLHPDYFIAGTRDVDNPEERGYFYISENDPDNDADDVLQLTVNGAEFDLGNEDEIIYSGRARPLAATWNSGSPGVPVNPDQPIWDDGVGFKRDPTDPTQFVGYDPDDNGTGESTLAEVSYFLRNGNLYRRVLLIRQPRFPSDSASNDQPYDDVNGQDFIPGNYTGAIDPTPTAGGESDFWNDFDYSASRLDPKDGTASTPKMFFHWDGTLDNRANTFGTPTYDGRYQALGNPRNRFGHDPSPRLGGDRLQGRPKEFMVVDNAATSESTFIGRYTHEETSNESFRHPGLPFDPTPPLPYEVITPFSPEYDDTTAPGDNVPDDFVGAAVENRKAEDLLLANVHAFDIEVWDAAIQRWVDLGHTNSDGDWHLRQIYQAGNPTGNFNTILPSTNVPYKNASAIRAMYRYGSLDSTLAPNSINRIFDTWHPGFDFDTTDTVAATPNHTLDDPPPFRPQWTDRTNFTTESGGTDPAIWQASNFYSEGERVFPVPTPQGGGDYPGHQSLFYECVTAGTSGAGEPGWTATPGSTVSAGGGAPVWVAVNNTIGLQAMRITIRFLDPTSQQMRQVSLVHSFIER